MNPAPTTLRQVIEAYARLETRVRRLMQRHCAPSCSSCTCICCRYDICEESLDSVFLNLVHAVHQPGLVPSESHGWLAGTGCTLEVGRPPVCYEFLCDRIMDAMPDDDARYALRTLGLLLTYLGRNALGTRHLITIRDHEMLLRVKPGRVMKRLDACLAALAVVEQALEGLGIDEAGHAILGRICPPDVKLYQGE